MKKKATGETLRVLPLLSFGIILYVFSTLLLNGVTIIPGSTLGLAIIANKALAFPVGLVNLILNIPIMIVATKQMGKKVLIYTVIIVASTSILIDLLTPYCPEINTNFYFIALISGAVMGVGAGMLIRAGGTMAGTTALTLIILARLPKQKIKFGMILCAEDCLIMLLGAAILKQWEAVLPSLIYTLVVSKMMDMIIYFRKGRQANA